MDTRTATASPTTEAPLKQSPPEVPQDKIAAYYSLVFPHFTFYIQTLSVTIGRRCPNSNSSNAATSSTAEPPQIDVDLGALKSVSRLHAKIEYDQDDDRFVLIVIGRNGAWVDGVWSGSGTRAPLSERSQIQIATRTFHFLLPPPPPPEDTPSPSSQSSANRHRSPSVDITSISPPSSQPPHSPPPPQEDVKSPPLSVELPEQPQLPNSNAIGKANKAANSKKRKKTEVKPAEIPPRPKPEDIPPKPALTYAQLIYRAINAIGGKATLQEICTWIMNTHEYYRYADGAWMSSVRHNLSSGRAFMKMERCGGDRGKGFFWSLDEKYRHTFEEQEAKSEQAALQSGSKEGPVKGKKKDKGALLEPALKRSVKGDLKGTPLPPPLTSMPLAMKSASTAIQSFPPSVTGTTATTGLFGYPTQNQHAHPVSVSQSANGGSGATNSNPYAVLTQPWGLVQGSPALSAATQPGTSNSPTSIAPTQSSSTPQPPQTQNTVPDVNIPIVLGPIPPSHPDYAPSHPNNSAKEGYMILHEKTLILDPDVFSGLTPELLAELERMGARAALGVLTSHMVRALKERRARRGRERGSKRGRGAGVSGRGKRGGGARGAGGGLPTESPFTHAPLEPRMVAGATETSEDGSSGAPHANPGANPIAPVPVPPPPSDPGSPLLVVDDDSGDEGPALKKRKVEETTIDVT